MSPRFDFQFDPETPVTCRHCGHVGRGSFEFFEAMIDVECGRCGERLFALAIPTHDDIRQAAAAGDERAIASLEGVEERERFLARVAEHALRSPDEFAAVPGDEPFVATMTLEGDWFVWRAGDVELAREIATYESGDRYEEVVALMAKAYGGRLRAVEPVGGAETWVLGDRLSWVGLIERVNAEMFGTRG